MRIIERLPLLTASRTVRFRERYVPFHRNALVLWLSIGRAGNENPHQISAAFPVLLDSGNNSECFLHEHHLRHWAGIQPNQLVQVGELSINNQAIAQIEADVWIHPNVPGTYELDPQRSPFRLEIFDGVSVGRARPDNEVFPRAPLLGFSALKRNAVDYWFDSKSGCSYLRTADWRSRLVRLLYQVF